MCGIVGYVGNKKAAPILIAGLKRLEYRGYDSAGIVLMEKEGEPLHVRTKGRVTNLETALNESLPSKATLGIAHTRWATHGAASARNAHPHTDCTGTIFVVHNGIIENYTELKTGLIAAGCTFSSETDTEILAHLLEREYARLSETERTVFRAVQNALRQVRGSYAIAVTSTFDPSAIIVARYSSPLAIGMGKGEIVIASDAAILPPLCKKSPLSE